MIRIIKYTATNKNVNFTNKNLHLKPCTPLVTYKHKDTRIIIKQCIFRFRFDLVNSINTYLTGFSLNLMISPNQI